MRYLWLLAWSVPAWAVTPKDSGGDSTPYDDSGGGDDSAGSGSGSGAVPAPPENDYDGHLDGELASQMANDDGGCASAGSQPADLVLVLVVVGLAAGRLRRPRR